MKRLLYCIVVETLLVSILINPAFAAGDLEKEPGTENSAIHSEKEPYTNLEYPLRKIQIAETPEGKLQPWRLLRSIQRAQDDIVSGKKNAIKAYRILLLQSANWMKNLDSSTWQFQKNLDAVGVYLLIGGDVELGYKALRYSRLERPYKIFLEAAIAYAEQDVRTANSLFQSVDHTQLPPSISGQVALAKSMMMSSSDLEKASRYLDEARKLSPGTLVEEAAIRRSVRIAAETKNRAKLRRLLRTYLFRFPNSYYFNDFLRNISFALVNTLGDPDTDMVPEFQYLLKRINRVQRIAVAEYAMRRAVISGNHDLVDWLAEETIPETDESSKAHTRLSLYHLAAKIGNYDEVIQTVEDLEALPIGRLSSRDLKIYEVVSATVQSILFDEEFPFTEGQVDSTLSREKVMKDEDVNMVQKDPLEAQVKRMEHQVSQLEKLAEGTER